MPLQIIRNDISKVKADAIVNTANPEVAVGAGVDEAIYRAAGFDQLLEERAKIGPMKPGQAAPTPAFDLDAKYIIHTVGPAWIDGSHGEREAVASCYRESLRIADEKDCESVAFPLISTGTYGFPKDDALRIAINEISSFLFEHEMTVYMVVYDKESFVLSGKAFQGVRTFIEEKDVKPRRLSREERNVSTAAGGSLYQKRSKSSKILSRRERAASLLIEEAMSKEDVSYSMDMDIPAGEVPPHPEELMAESVKPADEWDDGLRGAVNPQAETFQEMLFRLIDRKGLKDPEVYKRANMDRKLFSKIRSNKDYLPTKRNVIALAMALSLNLDETMDLLRRAGYALSPSILFDRIVVYCILNKIYDIYEVNLCLFEYTDQVLA